MIVPQIEKMIGLYCLFSRTDNRNFPVLGQVPPRTVVVRRSAPGVRLAAVIPTFRERQSIADSGSDWVVIDGFSYNNTDAWITAAELLHALKQSGPAAVEALNGEFAIAAFVGGVSWMFTDRMGTRQHAIARANDCVAIAPQPVMALKSIKPEPKVDHRAIAAFLFTNKIRHKRSTLWQDCEILPPATSLHWNGESVKVDRYWRMKYRPDEDRVAADSGSF